MNMLPPEENSTEKENKMADMLSKNVILRHLSRCKYIYTLNNQSVEKRHFISRARMIFTTTNKMLEEMILDSVKVLPSLFI